MAKILVLATSNRDKVREVSLQLKNCDFQLLSLSDLGLKVDAIESADSFKGNSEIKALDIANKCPYPVLSDDSGLCIRALDNFPGVHSARFMKEHSYAEKCSAILDLLQDVEDRSAYFTCSLTYIDKERGIKETFQGISEGEIVKHLIEYPQGAFGYDPIFYSYDLKKTFAEATALEKIEVSHRGRALMSFIKYIKENNYE